MTQSIIEIQQKDSYLIQTRLGNTSINIKPTGWKTPGCIILVNSHEKKFYCPKDFFITTLRWLLLSFWSSSVDNINFYTTHIAFGQCCVRTRQTTFLIHLRAVAQLFPFVQFPAGSMDFLKSLIASGKVFMM